MTAAGSSEAGGRDRPNVSLQSLAIASVSSVAAAFVASHLWGSGTLLSAALTPVVVSLVSEGLRRQTALVESRAPRPSRSVEERFHRYSSRGRWWRVALLTGMLGFAVAVVIITVPDLVRGKSITGNGGRTTFFGGRSASKHPTTPTTSSPASPSSTTASSSTTPASSTTASSTTATTTSTSATSTAPSAAGARSTTTGPTTTPAP